MSEFSKIIRQWILFRLNIPLTSICIKINGTNIKGHSVVLESIETSFPQTYSTRAKSSKNDFFIAYALFVTSYIILYPKNRILDKFSN